MARLDRQVTAEPWREEGWRLLALSLYRSDRQAEALAVLRRARERLAGELKLDPGSALAELETRILNHDPRLDPFGGTTGATTGAAGVTDVVAAYSRTGRRAQLEAANALLTGLAVAGDPATARQERLAVIAAAEGVGDPELTARVFGGFEVPGVWTRSDDPGQAAVVVAASERALRLFDSAQSSSRSRARLLATVALESRGTLTVPHVSCGPCRLSHDIVGKRVARGSPLRRDRRWSACRGCCRALRACPR